jgi:2,3-bisphosphoglycerate-independent phosphoglycerate mutase
MRELDGIVLITADHGNSEEMLDKQTGRVKTSHTLNPVECVWVASDAEGRTLKSGKLSDLAPTVLELMGLDVPPEMTAESLLGDS